MTTTEQDSLVTEVTSSLPFGDEEGQSAGDFKTFSFVCNLIVIPIVCALGLVGNMLGIRVLWRDTKRQDQSIYVYLCALTITDTVYLGIGLVRIVPSVIEYFDRELASYLDSHMNLGFIYIDMCVGHTSAALIVIMSFERLLALVRPLRVKDTWFAQYPLQLILFCVVFNVLFLLPFPISLEVQSAVSGNNKTVHFVQFEAGMADDMETYMIVQTVVDFFIPICILLVINVAIPIQYYRLVQSRRTTFSSQQPTAFASRQAKVTITIFTVTVMYLLLSIPNLIVKVLAFVDPEYSFDGKNSAVFWLFIDLSNMFTHINAANDFVIYILVSDMYRKVFMSMYCDGCCGAGAPSDADRPIASAQTPSSVMGSCNPIVPDFQSESKSGDTTHHF